jgi:hypothetical protein
LAFFAALESTKTQLVGRAWQRGIGETLIKRSANEYFALTFVEFTELFLSNNDFRRWYQPLVSVLMKLNDTNERQKLLVYGTIIHALIDTLDEKHFITGQKPGWPNKLSKKSKRALRYRVFKVYLPFVVNPNKYIAG